MGVFVNDMIDFARKISGFQGWGGGWGEGRVTGFSIREISLVTPTSGANYDRIASTGLLQYRLPMILKQLLLFQWQQTSIVLSRELKKTLAINWSQSGEELTGNTGSASSPRETPLNKTTH